MATPKDKFEEIRLIDTETNEEFPILVSSQDANRARMDITFATKLLQQAKNSTQPTYTSPQAGSSSSSQDSAANSVTTAECAEGAHAWTKQETLLLLEMYHEHQLKFVGGKGTVKKHWDDIAQLMQEKGHSINGYKCSTKFQSLKRTYKRIIDHNRKSGNNRKDWEYLQIMQELFCDKPWVQPLAVAGSHLRDIGNEINLEEEEEKETFSQPTSKKTKTNVLLDDYLSFSREERKKHRKTRAQQHEEEVAAFKRIENILQQLLEKENK